MMVGERWDESTSVGTRFVAGVWGIARGRQMRIVPMGRRFKMYEVPIYNLLEEREVIS